MPGDKDVHGSRRSGARSRWTRSVLDGSRGGARQRQRDGCDAVQCSVVRCACRVSEPSHTSLCCAVPSCDVLKMSEMGPLCGTSLAASGGPTMDKTGR